MSLKYLWIFNLFFVSYGFAVPSTSDKLLIFDEMEELSHDRVFVEQSKVALEREKISYEMETNLGHHGASAGIELKTSEWKYKEALSFSEASKYNLEAQELLVGLLLKKDTLSADDVEEIQKKRLQLKIAQAKSRVHRTTEEVDYRKYVLETVKKLYEQKTYSLGEYLDARKEFDYAIIHLKEAEHYLKELEEMRRKGKF